MEKCIHHEDSSKCSEYRRIFTQIDEKEDKNHNKKEKTYHSTLYKLLDVPALWDIVVLCGEDKSRILFEENL